MPPVQPAIPLLRIRQVRDHQAFEHLAVVPRERVHQLVHDDVFARCRGRSRSSPLKVRQPFALVVEIPWLAGIRQTANGEFWSGSAAQMISRGFTLIYLKHFPTSATQLSHQP